MTYESPMRIEGFITNGWDDAFVEVDGERLSPERSQETYNHSPGGFAWGYGGSGPSQLALAILLEAGLDDKTSLDLHQEFKWQFLATLPQEDHWTLNLDVLAWSRKKLEESE